MYNEKKIKDKVIRRVLLLGILQVSLLSLIISRLYKLQIIENDKYKIQSDNNRINFIIHTPLRGKIFDSNGIKLAENKKIHSLYITPLIIKDMTKFIDIISEIVMITDEEKNIFTQKLENSKRRDIPILLKRYLSWKELSILSVNIDKFPGINIKIGFIREYIKGSYYAHIIGYTSKEQKFRSFDIPEKQFGKVGIEKSYNDYLKGVPGTEEIEVNALGKFVRRLSLKKSEAGANITLTINSELQKYSQERLNSNIGAAIIMDADNGDILSAVSSPSYDPNIFTKPLNKDLWNKISKQKDSPLINRAFSGLYPPGSTFKPVIALAALRYNLISPNDKVFCNGVFILGNRNFHCWKKGGHGTLNLESAISESCDIYFYELALKLGIKRISETAKDLGFGSYYNNFFGKPKTIIPNKKWKKKTYNESWQKGETLNVGIGQGFLLVTPLELAVMTANIITTNNFIIPNIIKSINEVKYDSDLMNSAENVFDIDHLNLVKKGMYKVLNSPKGTAWKSRVEDKDFPVSGKTGTSQVRIISSLEREKGILKNEDLPWNKRDHALFIGFAPYKEPKYVTAVILEHAGGGSSNAAPVGKDLLLAARKYLSGIETKHELNKFES